MYTEAKPARAHREFDGPVIDLVEVRPGVMGTKAELEAEERRREERNFIIEIIEIFVIFVLSSIPIVLFFVLLLSLAY